MKSVLTLCLCACIVQIRPFGRDFLEVHFFHLSPGDPEIRDAQIYIENNRKPGIWISTTSYVQVGPNNRVVQEAPFFPFHPGDNTQV